MTEEDWPSLIFRDHIVIRLESELQNRHRNANKLPGPNDAHQLEEYIFNKCTIKDEYMRTVAKVINEISNPVDLDDPDALI